MVHARLVAQLQVWSATRYPLARERGCFASAIGGGVDITKNEETQRTTIGRDY